MKVEKTKLEGFITEPVVGGDETRFSSRNLYVVRPSVIIVDNTEDSWNETASEILKEPMIEKKRSLYESMRKANIHRITRIIRLESQIQDTTIAIKRLVAYEDVVTHEIYFPLSEYGSYEDDKVVDVYQNDRILLAKYLWKQNVKKISYDYEIEDYVLYLKPFYTLEEILTLLKEIKEEVLLSDEEPKVFEMMSEREEPVFAPRNATEYEPTVIKRHIKPIIFPKNV